MLIFWKLNNSLVFPSDAPQIDNEESMLFGTDGFVFMIEEKEIVILNFYHNISCKGCFGISTITSKFPNALVSVLVLNLSKWW